MILLLSADCPICNYDGYSLRRCIRVSLSRNTGLQEPEQSMQSFQPNLLFNNSKKISLLVRNHGRVCCNCRGKETPLCTSWRGSYTVEAAVCLPLMICFMIFIIFFIQIFRVQSGVQRALDDAGKTAAVAAEVLGEDTDGGLAAIIAACNAGIVGYHVPAGYIRGGLAGIRYGNSSIDGNYVKLTACYTIEFPIGMFGRYRWDIYQCADYRKWVGWDRNEEMGDGRYVYVTKHGSAYHTNLQCSYLQPKISAVGADEVGDRRSEDGSIYYPCPACHGDREGIQTVYVAAYGTVYHSSRSCSSLKRSICRILLENADGYHPCSKCVVEGGL